MSKKAHKNNEPETNYAERDIVLGKVRGYPPWPGMVRRVLFLPRRGLIHHLYSYRLSTPTLFHPWSPRSALLARRRHSTVSDFSPQEICAFHRPCLSLGWLTPFSHSAWLVSKDISRLKEHEIRAYISEPHKKSGDLLAGYRIALDPQNWEKEKESMDLAAAEQEDNARVDQLETENEDDEAKKPAKSKKRKRDAEGPSAKPKGKPKPKSEKKAATGRPRKNGTKSKEMIESEDDGDQEADAAAEDENAGVSTKAAPPPSKKPKREKEEEVDGEFDIHIDLSHILTMPIP